MVQGHVCLNMDNPFGSMRQPQPHDHTYPVSCCLCCHHQAPLVSASNVQLGMSQNRHVLHMSVVQPDWVNSDWTYATTFTYNVTEADVRLNDNLVMYIKNPDPLTSAWDEYRPWTFGRLPVTDGRLPAVVRDVRVEYADSNKVIPKPDATLLPVGTKVRFVASGSDPKGPWAFGVQV